MNSTLLLKMPCVFFLLLMLSFTTIRAQTFIANADTTVTPPTFKGGMDEFYNRVGRTFLYPVYARQHGIQGKVISVFDMDSTGRISNIRILNGLSPDIGEEMLRMLQKTEGNWLPAKKNGLPVSYQGYVLPINLNLEGLRGVQDPKLRIPKAYEEYRAALQQKEYSNALSLILEIIRAEPSPENFAASAWIKEKLGDKEGARTDMEKALFLGVDKAWKKVDELEAGGY
ncbi:energy transducer TonB [Arcticibacter sp. MXS-1]|uniref:energy transducer TonB n=1 Tax=Arcticibacter sp. MXS-1 TaxID=3341726 RepID=UPI0035A90DF4